MSNQHKRSRETATFQFTKSITNSLEMKKISILNFPRSTHLKK